MKYIQPQWPAPSHIKAYTTSKQGWDGNRLGDGERLKELLQLPGDPQWLDQKHGIKVIEASQDRSSSRVADAIFSTKPHHICAVLTADCLPMLICNRQGTHVAAIHAGWRGLGSGIVEETLQTIHRPPEDLLVWLGPAIGPTKFEVGSDVYEHFVSKHPAASRAFTNLKPGKWLANLYELAKIRLHLLGVKQIYGGDFCTFSQSELFFSYRRDKSGTGRMASLIWIDSN